MLKRYWVLGIFLLPTVLFAQLETDADFRRQVYDYEFTGGIMLHTRGLGINLRYLKFQDGFKKRGVEFDLVGIKHPKEIKSPGQNPIGPSRSYVYGKLNGLYALRLGVGLDKVMVDKTDQGSISIDWVNFAGASLGLLKPVYVDVILETPNGSRIVSVERYDPAKHDFVSIYGQAPFFTGIDKTQLRLGVYYKTGFSFDYNWNDHKVSSIEVGAIVDYYPSWFGMYAEDKVPIMYDATNYNVWLQFYVTLNFGAKWN